MPLPEYPPGRLPHDGVGLDEQIVECLALLEALLEFHRLVSQGVVAEALQLGLQGADQGDQLGQTSDLLALTGAQDLGEHAHEGPILPVGGHLEPPRAGRHQVGLRAADLVFDPTLACREGDAPVRAARWRSTGPSSTVVARVASSPCVPDSRARHGQGLHLSRTMISDHKSPYVGRFACDWPRLATTDPHAARFDRTRRGPADPGGALPDRRTPILSVTSAVVPPRPPWGGRTALAGRPADEFSRRQRLHTRSRP